VCVRSISCVQSQVHNGFDVLNCCVALQNDPAAAQRHVKQPQIMAKLQKLVSAGIVKMA
jgi:hypothetical protein